MKIAKPVKIDIFIYIVLSIIEGIILYSILKNDDGLYAQITVPLIFGVFHILITYITTTQIFIKHNKTLNLKLKILIGIIIAIPFGVALWKIPLLNSIF